MLLQRAPAAPVVWGFAAPGVTVDMVFRGLTRSATAGLDGVWRVEVPPTEATSEGTTLTFTASDGGSAKLERVVFGELLLCSGQSNMAWTQSAVAKKGCSNPDRIGSTPPCGFPETETHPAGGYPAIRLLTVQTDEAAEPLA